MTDEFLFRRLMDLTPDEKAALADHWRSRSSDTAVDDTTGPEAEVTITTDDGPHGEKRDAYDVMQLTSALETVLWYLQGDTDITPDEQAKIATIVTTLVELITAEAAEAVAGDETNSAPSPEGRTQETPVEPARTTPTRAVKHSYLTNRKVIPSWKLP